VGGTTETAIDVRVVAATNRELEAEVARGAFRSDLYYRLNVIELRLPPLRQRNEDVPLLVEHFLRRFARDHGKAVSALTPAAMKRLEAYDFPGNVRELENIIERAVALSSGSLIEESDLPALRTSGVKPAAPAGDIPDDGVDLDRLVADYERAWVQKALDKAGGVRKKAAHLLGITFRSMRYRLEKLGLEKGDDGED
jgi:two-component system response regulator PilR (NtrC family)